MGNVGDRGRLRCLQDKDTSILCMCVLLALPSVLGAAVAAAGPVLSRKP